MTVNFFLKLNKDNWHLFKERKNYEFIAGHIRGQYGQRNKNIIWLSIAVHQNTFLANGVTVDFMHNCLSCIILFLLAIPRKYDQRQKRSMAGSLCSNPMSIFTRGSNEKFWCSSCHTD